MDLTKRGCHLCEDWPCVAACEPNALAMAVTQLAPDKDGNQPPPMPKLASLSIDRKTCLPYLGPECGACAHVCPVPGALLWPDGLKPEIDAAVCTGCALCREACITEPKSITVAAVARMSGGEDTADPQ